MSSGSSMKKLSAFSGLAFGCFLAVHLLSHYTIFLLGFELSNSIYLPKLRTVYQSPLFEIGIFLSLGIHMYANTCIYMNRKKLANNPKKNDDSDTKSGGTTKNESSAARNGKAELKAHRYAGYFLGASMLGHISATRVIPFFVLDDPSQYDYTFVADANNHIPYNFFLAYLALLGIAGGWHLIYGTWSAIATISGSSRLGTPVPIFLKVMAMTNHILILASVLTLGGFFYEITSNDKSELHAKVREAMGM